MIFEFLDRPMLYPKICSLIYQIFSQKISLDSRLHKDWSAQDTSLNIDELKLGFEISQG